MPQHLTREEIVSIQVLRKKGVPFRGIAKQFGVAESTVRYHVARGESGAADGRAGKARRADAFQGAITEWIASHEAADLDRPPNLKELHEHLVADHGYAGSYKSIVRWVRAHFGKPRIRTYRRVETPPGAQAQTDWGHFKGFLIDGEPADPMAFVMALSHSRKPAVIWSPSRSQVHWLRCHNRAFSRLGGIPAVNRVDNEKTAVSHGAGSWGRINPVYATYARSLRFHVDACQPRQPQAKGKSEAKVKLTRQLQPSRRVYDSWEELQAETDAKVDAWSQRRNCPVTGKTIWDTWREEQAFLQPLPPALPEPFDTVVQREVQRDCLVNFEGRQYTVPFEYVGRLLEVRGCAGKVQLFHAGKMLREYERGTNSRLLVDPTCYEGESTERVVAPQPLGKMGRRLQEIYDMPVETRPLDLYAALAEVAR